MPDRQSIDVPPPGWRPQGRSFSAAYDEAVAMVGEWVVGYGGREHLERARDWLLWLDPDAPEPVAVAAYAHDAERLVPGGPELDMAVAAWDDAEYNEAHCQRSAAVVERRLRQHGAPERFVLGVRDPILQHEFGGTRDGTLMQAADSLSWLEVHADQAAGWAIAGRCSVEKARAKLDWMRDRVRHPAARELCRALHVGAIAEFDRLVAAAGAAPAPQTTR